MAFVIVADSFYIKLSSKVNSQLGITVKIILARYFKDDFYYCFILF
jgi:hypothetical protein